MKTIAHLWVLDCPVDNQATVQIHTFSQIYTTITTITAATVNVLASPLGAPLVEK